MTHIQGPSSLRLNSNHKLLVFRSGYLCVSINVNDTYNFYILWFFCTALNMPFKKMDKELKNDNIGLIFINFHFIWCMWNKLILCLDILVLRFLHLSVVYLFSIIVFNWITSWMWSKVGWWVKFQLQLWWLGQLTCDG